MKQKIHLIALWLVATLFSCNQPPHKLNVSVVETSRSGHKLSEIRALDTHEKLETISIFPKETYQKLIGFGGAFTESSAYLLNRVGEPNRQKIIEAYFSEKGAHYSLTRTHINSCDFSLGNYSYAPVENDMQLDSFSIHEDKDDIIPMIKEALAISPTGFKIISSPWTAPPWMKDNNDWKGGKLLPEYYHTWALFFEKYLAAYKQQGIDVWAITVENEPLGNGNNWESMHYTPKEMVTFVNNHLGPKLEASFPEVQILGYDQNRDELKEWVDVMYENQQTGHYFDGTAIHWYASTYDFMPEALNYAYNKAPEKMLIETEGCVDAEVPHWNDDDWYWRQEATDWGWDWASEQTKHLHPKYVSVYRYARDIIGCLNNYVQGWVDWNMVLDRQGGPNWAKNWCVAPVIVDPQHDQVYFTPLYYTMAHFSKYIRPDAVRIGFENPFGKQIMVTAAQNPDGSVVVVVLNMSQQAKSFRLKLNDKAANLKISAQALQTIVIAKV